MEYLFICKWLAAGTDDDEGLPTDDSQRVSIPQYRPRLTQLRNGARTPKKLWNAFNSCAGDEQCAKFYPDLKTTFYALLDRLDAEPMVFTVSNQYSGERYQVTLDSDRLITYLLLLF